MISTEDLRKDKAELENLEARYDAMLQSVRLRLANVNFRLESAAAEHESLVGAVSAPTGGFSDCDAEP